MDYNFTANIEKEFDEVAEGEKEWTGLMKDFYSKFEPMVENTIAAKSERKVGERLLGTDPASGKPVSVKIGRFGPVVQIGSAEDEEKPRFAQMTKGQSMDNITLEEALALFRLPRTLGEFEGHVVSVGAGRFGPYVLYDKKYISIPKGMDPMTITLEEAVQLINEKRRGRDDRNPQRTLRPLHCLQGKELQDSERCRTGPTAGHPLSGHHRAAREGGTEEENQTMNGQWIE